MVSWLAYSKWPGDSETSAITGLVGSYFSLYKTPDFALDSSTMPYTLGEATVSISQN